MEQTQGLKNFTVNIKPLMLKLRASSNQGLTLKVQPNECESIVNFYLEVVDYLSKQ